MNLDDYSYEENGRRYVRPEVGLDERNAFIEQLRASQPQQLAKIRQDTYDLGSALPSNLGGLSGGSSYFTSRYYTPQTNFAISDLRSVAQSQALSELLSNEIGKAKKLYNDAYRAAKKRESNGGSGGSNSSQAAIDALKSIIEKDNSSGIKDSVFSGTEEFAGPEGTEGNQEGSGTPWYARLGYGALNSIIGATNPALSIPAIGADLYDTVQWFTGGEPTLPSIYNFLRGSR